jgi:hypothetical protein
VLDEKHGYWIISPKLVYFILNKKLINVLFLIFVRMIKLLLNGDNRHKVTITSVHEHVGHPMWISLLPSRTNLS